MAAARAAADKKGHDVTVLDLQGLSPLTDYFVIVSAGNVQLTKAIAEHVEEAVEEAGGRLRHREGRDSARWILLDFGDVIVHVFHTDEREFYSLERLWADAAVLPLGPEPLGPEPVGPEGGAAAAT
jgi:ribosome-associated protein